MIPNTHATMPEGMKDLRELHDLARFGAPPLFGAPRHVNRPMAPARAAFDAQLDRAWEKRWFTNDGPLVQELERRLEQFLDVPHCVLTCNATIAMTLVLQALEVKGEVLLPSYTFISTAHVLRLAGLAPVFCDVGQDMTLDPDACRERLSSRTGAVIPTHVWGRPCDIEALQALCDEAGIPLILDAAHAFGSRHDGQRVGRFGQAEIFSLHATKAFHACEGGLVATCDGDLAKRLRLMRNFGFSGSDQVDCAGTNAKMSELHAAMGLANLDIWPQTCAAARRVHAEYRDGLASVPGLTLRVPPDAEDNNGHYVVAEIDADTFGLSRDQLCTLLSAENVLARRYFFPGGHLSPPHLERSRALGLRLPQTEALCDKVLVLPGGAAMEPADAAQVCALIRFVAAQAGEICAAMTR